MLCRLACIIALTISGLPAMAELSLGATPPGLKLVAMDRLPTAPAAQGETAVCTHLFVETIATPGGQDAAAKGWKVTSEQALGDLIAVSFVGNAIPATSGTCELTDGNVGFYAQGQLVALLYSTNPEALLIGRLRSFGDGLRLLSGDVLPGTVADIGYDGTTLGVTAPIGEEPVCNGTALVPAIEGLPIDKARDLLIGAGWQPIPGDPEQQAFSQAAEIVARGLPEVEDCSGTGFAFCAFGYTGPAGTLDVITVGEVDESGGLPQVSRYSVDCR